MRMNPESAATLVRLIRGQRIAALGTLRQGAPLVSMVLYLPGEDLSTLYLHVSRLAWHTQDMLMDARVSLSIAAGDDGAGDPQQLARVSLRGTTTVLARESNAHAHLKTAWLARFPESAINFELADFGFFRVQISDARLVAGFGRIHNLSAEDLVDGSNLA